jgi:hypothetical protein
MSEIALGEYFTLGELFYPWRVFYSQRVIHNDLLHFKICRMH